MNFLFHRRFAFIEKEKKWLIFKYSSEMSVHNIQCVINFNIFKIPQKVTSNQ